MPDSAKRISQEGKRPTSCKRDSAMSASTTQPRWDSNSHFTRERWEEHKGPQEYSNRPSSDGQNTSLHEALPWQAPHSHPELEPVPELSPFPSILTMGQRNADDSKYAQPTPVPGHESKPNSFGQVTAYQDKVENVKEGISAPEVRRAPQVVNFSRPFSSGYK